MINLLPTNVKGQVKFAKHNTQVLNYFRLVVLVAIIVTAGFGGTYVYLNQRFHQATEELSQKQLLIDNFSSLQSNVRTLNQRVTAIQNLQASQTKFSTLLTDLAAYMPKGTYLNSISLTGDSSKPVLISATADSYNQAVALRDALANSPRISGADIESVTNGSQSVSVQIVLGFKPGAAK